METNKITPTKTFFEFFDVILTGNKDDSRKAAREVRKFLYSFQSIGKYDQITTIIESAPNSYANIKEDWREENFVVAVSVLYFLHNKKSRPDFLFPWLFYLLQHENGNIRHSAFRMFQNQLGSITVHIRCPDKKYGKVSSEQADAILCELFTGLHNLLTDLWKPVYKKYKYVSSLPTCPYKTVQMVLCEMEYNCGEVYMNQLRNKFWLGK